MKKWIITVLLVTLITGLTACSGTENAEKIYSKAITAAEEMESAEVIIDMKQQMQLPNEAESVEMTSNMEGSMIVDPLAMHQKGNVSISLGEMAETPMEMEQELYLVDNEMYMFESMSNQWMKIDDSMIPMDMVNSQQMDVSEQLDMMKEYVEELSVEETEDEYILKLSADGDGIKEFSDKFVKEVMPEDIMAQLGEEVADVLKNMKINELLIEMIIHKDTYQMSAYNMDMDMTISQDGEEMNIKQVVKTIYQNINTIESLEVPQNVKDSAVEAPSL
ncbi:DUF6612 family protein [Oceanobacillus senegalensis]|uniref:DUF6612 family protein n=1 Tax=Oceanobacillus senegalensis TaxID=1936063 RepID=UPI000A3091CF|nr:DUF6612 family protein [Oceanobacillus senegalensis]